MPEKGSSEISRPLRELYDKGMAAYERNNLDYAIAIFNQILQSEPGFYDARQALRKTQFKKVGAKSGFFKKVFGTASSSPQLAKGQLLLRSNPLEALKTAESVLNNDPNNVSAHKLLADAALEADLPRTAVLSLELAFKAEPGDRDIGFALGKALARASQIERAEKVYSELQRVFPRDQEIAQALKNISARRTMVEGGYEQLSTGAGSFRDILKDKSEALSLEQEQREVKTEDVSQRLIAEYQAKLAHDPANTKLMRTVAQLHARQNDFSGALRYYEQIARREGGSDPTLDKEIAETKLRQFDQQIAQLQPGQPEYETQKAQLLKKRREFQRAECAQRAERYPSDLGIRFELGQLYFEAGQLSEAIKEFQRAQANPHLRSQALRCLGECFARRGMFDLAVRTFQNAIKEKLTFDGEKKELIYQLGAALEKMGKSQEAVEQFKLIYEVDIGYKDVAAKVDAYYASR